MARTAQMMNERQMLAQKEKSGRFNLLLAIILTVVNIALFLGGSDTMMLFSISVPYYAVIFGAIIGGEEMVITGCVIAAVMLLVYFVCWLLSKKRTGWLIAALVLMIVDTLALVGFYFLAGEISGILDFFFHAMILYYLISGVVASGRLKKLPPEEPVVSSPVDPDCDSAPIRRIEEGEKCRVLLESTYGAYRIVYRRVKKTNQLVINNYIYDEITMTLETAHSLSARIDGHEIVVGFDGISSTYLLVDGNQVVKKMRLY